MFIEIPTLDYKTEEEVACYRYTVDKRGTFNSGKKRIKRYVFF